jgi:hypothetical protein
MPTPDSRRIVEEFLMRFYHQEPDETRAATKALLATATNIDYRWEVAEAFRDLLERTTIESDLTSTVSSAANRRAKDAADARQFLLRVYETNDLDAAVNLNELTD